MKILHFADIHFRHDLLEEICKCTDYMIDKASEHKIDLVITAGDLFDERQSYDSPVFLKAVEFILKLCKIAPLFILKGTNSHDGNSLKFLESLSPERICVSESIEQVVFGNGRFEKSSANTDSADLIISSLPSVSKAQIALNLNDLNESNQTTVDLIREVLRSWAEVNQNVEVPTILAGHISLTGASLSTGQQLMGREIELGAGDLRMAGADLVCLGHIHKAQSWGEIYYSGSITRLNFGEEEEKGFWIHEFHGKKVNSQFINTPSRSLKTIDIGILADSENITALSDKATDVQDGAVVKIRYEVSEENVHSIDESVLKSKLLKSGASEVKIEKRVIPKQRVRAEGITLLSPAEKLKQWGEITNTLITDSITRKLDLLVDETDVILTNQYSDLYNIN